MKTTIEINGYEVVIEETEGSISVSASKEGEVVEEFTIETEAGDETGDDSDSDLQAFGEEESDFDDSEDLEDSEENIEDSEEDFEAGEEDLEEAEEDLEDVEEEGKLESFNSFIRKRK